MTASRGHQGSRTHPSQAFPNPQQPQPLAPPPGNALARALQAAPRTPGLMHEARQPLAPPTLIGGKVRAPPLNPEYSPTSHLQLQLGSSSFYSPTVPLQPGLRQPPLNATQITTTEGKVGKASYNQHNMKLAEHQVRRASASNPQPTPQAKKSSAPTPNYSLAIQAQLDAVAGTSKQVHVSPLEPPRPRNRLAATGPGSLLATASAARQPLTPPPSLPQPWPVGRAEPPP